LTTRPRILCLGDPDSTNGSGLEGLRAACDVVDVESPLQAASLLADQDFDGLFVANASGQQPARIGRLLENERLLEGMPNGVVLLDADNTIVWANRRMREWACEPAVAGANFYSVLGGPEILGPDYCPFHTALATGQASLSNLRCSDNQYYQIHAAPILHDDSPPTQLIVTVQDVTAEVLQQQKLAAIHKAGVELADLTPAEVFNMEVDERIELLKENILFYTKDLLNFDVVEIRLLEQDTGRLTPLLSVGLDAEAAERPLRAQPQNNGVTGFVAATGKSYLCENTAEDPLYIEGFKGAKSSLTVPLILHDEVIGTFNVESPDTRAFTESDLQFLEIFSRDVAASLNTLELLVAQKANTAQQSVEAIHSAVALPVDEILNEAVNVMERYIGHEPEVVERIQHILRNARDIKQVIQKVGQKMAPAEAVPVGAQTESRPKLRGKRILVADDDAAVRSAAHALLERYGCVVETAHHGGEAVFMVRSCDADLQYDAIIADIRLPDISGYDLLVKLKGVMEQPPLILMSGFGYDPGHSIVKARQAGLAANAILYKPFRLDQLLERVESIIGEELPSATGG